MSVSAVPSSVTRAGPAWAWAALAVACAGLAGSLSLSWGAIVRYLDRIVARRR